MVSEWVRHVKRHQQQHKVLIGNPLDRRVPYDSTEHVWKMGRLLSKISSNMLRESLVFTPRYAQAHRADIVSTNDAVLIENTDDATNRHVVTNMQLNMLYQTIGEELEEKYASRFDEQSNSHHSSGGS